jgi:hypothetical protein
MHALPPSIVLRGVGRPVLRPPASLSKERATYHSQIAVPTGRGRPCQHSGDVLRLVLKGEPDCEPNAPEAWDSAALEQTERRERDMVGQQLMPVPGWQLRAGGVGARAQRDHYGHVLAPGKCADVRVGR